MIQIANQKGSRLWYQYKARLILQLLHLSPPIKSQKKSPSRQCQQMAMLQRHRPLLDLSQQLSLFHKRHLFLKLKKCLKNLCQYHHKRSPPLYKNLMGISLFQQNKDHQSKNDLFLQNNLFLLRRRRQKANQSLHIPTQNHPTLVILLQRAPDLILSPALEARMRLILRTIKVCFILLTCKIERPVVAKKPVSRFVDKQKVRSKTESLQSKPSKQLAAKEMAKINFKDKEQVMDEILCRWWYALPLWPPTDYDYSTVLKERKLRKVNPTSWLIEKNQDAEGYKKVVEVSGYPGLFMDYENELHDLRPKETCPSKTNLSKKPMAELAELLKKCYEEQLRQLKESKEGEKYFKKVEVDVAQRLHRLCVAYGFAQKPQQTFTFTIHFPCCSSILQQHSAYVECNAIVHMRSYLNNIGSTQWNIWHLRTPEYYKINAKTDISQRSSILPHITTSQAIDKKRKREDNPALKTSVFATALGKNQPDRSYYKSLYKFDPKTELSEYSLPFYADAAPSTKLPSGIINTTKLPPITKEASPREEDFERVSEEEVEEKVSMNPNGYQKEEFWAEPEAAPEAEIEDNGEAPQLDYNAFLGIIDKVNESESAKKNSNLFLVAGTPLYEQVKNIKTGEDCIAFFARYGNTTGVKFLHCNRAVRNKEEDGEEKAAAEDDFRPYDLQKVGEREKVNPEYFTISAQGVVHICPYQPKKKSKTSDEDGKEGEEGTIILRRGGGEKGETLLPTETYTLSEWMRESTLFNVLRKIKFFKYYISGKAFTMWKGIVRYQKFKRTREQLSKELIYSKRAFAEGYAEICGHINDLQNSKTFQTVKQSVTNLDSSRFKVAQMDRRNDFKREYECILKDRIHKKLEEIIKAVKESEEIKDEDEDSQFKTKQNAMLKSMVKMKEEERLKKHCSLLARQNKDMLVRLVQLVDWMIVESLIKINQDSVDLIYEEMTKSDKKTEITTEIDYGESSMVFILGYEGFLSMLKDIIDDMVKTMEVLNRVVNLIEDPVFRPGKKANIKKLIDRSEEFQSTKDHIEDKLASDFQACQEYADKTFYGLREIMDFIKTWSIETFKTKQGDPVQNAKNQLEKLEGWRKATKFLERHCARGMVYADGNKLCNILNTGTETASRELKQYLKELANDKTTFITDSLAELRKNLDPKDYTVVGNFCKLVTNYKRSDEVFKKLEKDKADTLEETLRILKKHRKDESSYTDDVPKLQETINKITNDVKEVKVIAEKAGETITKHKDNVIEALQKEVASLKGDIGKQLGYLDQEKLLNPEVEAEAALEELQRCQRNFTIYKNRFLKNKEQYAVLEMEDLRVKELDDYEKRFRAKTELWEYRRKWKDQYKHWFYSNLNEIDSEQFQRDFDDHWKKAQQLKIELGKEKKDPVMERFMNDVKLVEDMRGLIIALTNKALQTRHWQKIFKALGQEGAWNPGRVCNLTELLQYNLKERKEDIETIANAAVGEYNLQLQLAEIEHGWDQYIFTLIKDSKERFLLSETEKVYELLENDQMKISSMIASKYITEIRESVEEWETRLGNIFDILEEWLVCQRNWIYLESVFSAQDIQKQLPSETEKFRQVDRFWREIMNRTNKNKKIRDACASEGLKTRFAQNNACLDEIRKSLENYLRTKRKGFPRFYFLSDDELIAILSETRNPQAVQPHLRKCFDAIAHIDFTEVKNSKEMIAMMSAEGEKVPFSDSVFAEGNVEFWMGSIEAMMRRSLKDSTCAALKEYPPDGLDRKEWFFKFPAQSVITVDQIMWTKLCTEAIEGVQSGSSPQALEKFRDFCVAQINKMVVVVRGQLTKGQQAVVETLIVLDVHGRDVVKTLMNANVTSITDFDWQRQLRYYWEMPDDNCFVRQTKTRIEYSYEYIGNSGRLVITPLTDKCYMTLTGALNLCYGGNPQGPAGTGKTETTKDLAKAIGVQCVVFNCSDSLDINFMGRYFSGLAQCGAWSCFDEFNRIHIEVLSVIAQQILTIQSALREEKRVFTFEHDEIPLNPRFGTFITMNPGYAGRTELPDNLKALFRPISMMIPDYAMIAEIILFSQGFEKATALANKMVQLYRLSSEQLSKQDHYDFGMRAVKSVLVMAGALRKKYSDLGEDIVLIRAMRDSNVPKFLHQDLDLFNGIIRDLFPTVHIPNIPYGQLELQIKDVLKKQKLKDPADFVKKVIQLFETLLVRHGIMIVGETGTGKTTCCSCLARSLTELEGHTDDPMHKKVVVPKLNPKAISMKELYGYTKVDTNEWFTGLIPHLVSEVVLKDKSETKYWIMFDGPVDALWIENMNTVLDDSKMLCLANGERIKLPPTLTMMFEVQDLRVASPATVSRCGMVYLEPMHLGWEPIIDTWATQFEDQEKEAPEKAKEGGIKEKIAVEPKKDYGKEYAKLVTPIVKYLKEFVKVYLSPTNSMREKCKEKIPSVDVNLIKSCLNIFTSLIDPQYLDLKKKENPETLTLLLFLFSFIWSFGANIHESSRKEFNQFMKYKMTSYYTDFPESGEVYDYFVDTEKQQFVPWSQLVPEFAYKYGVPYFKIVVPTIDTVKYKYMLEKLAQGKCNVLFSGETGVGKTIIAQDFLNTAPEDIEWAFVNFSAKTTAGNLQNLFESKLDKKGKRYTPHSGKRMFIFFIDDVNMPQLDKYGSQPPCELLRQTIDQKGFYNLKKFFLHSVSDTIFIAACAPPGGGRNPVTPRLFRHFNMIWLPDVPQRSMEQIFTSILKGFLGTLTKNSGLDLVAPLIVKATVEVYLRLKLELLPTPTKCHYTFNLRDISKVVQGILQVNRDYLKDKTILLRLWLHESFRVFRDRLIENKDLEWFNDKITDMMKKHIEIDWAKDTFKDVLFAHFGNDESEYQEVTDVNAIIPKLNDQLEWYNSMNTGNMMNIVFFKDCISHLSRISRILRQQRGNALLVGVGGSGRRSMARLGASIAKFGSFEIEINKNYKEKDFHEDLKKLLKRAGIENQEIMFLFSDSQIMYESFLEDINNILNTGEVPNLFAPDEIEQIVSELRQAAKAEGKETRDLIMQFFVQRCREALHVILTFSPVGDMFRNRTRQFPSLINCCTIDWYHAWPADALQSVAQRKYEEEDEKAKLGIAQYIEQLSKISVEIHSTVHEASEVFFQELRRRNYTTPTSYLELTKAYIELMKQERLRLPANIKRYKRGLERMAATNKMVDTIKEELIRLGPEIDQREKETEKLVVEIEEKTKIAQEKENICQKEAQEAEVLVKQVEEIKKQCDSDLEKALPAFRAAQKALNTLDVNDIKEMKSYAKPVDAIATLMKCVCMLGGRTESWDEGRNWMNRPNDFLNDLKNYDKEHIPPKTLKKLKAYIDHPDLQGDISSKSKAAGSIHLWTKALYKFATVYIEVGPKMEKQKKAEGELKKMQAAMKGKKDELAKIKNEVADLRASHIEKNNQLVSLKEQRQLNELHKSRAEQLLVGLADESERWKVSMAAGEEKLVNVVGNMMLCAGYLSYLGPFTTQYRESLLKRWIRATEEQGVPFSKDFTFEGLLGDQVLIREWNTVHGLPADKFSIENGIIAHHMVIPPTNSKGRWPLIIDPQGQANFWIKKMEAENNIRTIRLTDPKYSQYLINAIRIGQPVLLENIDETLDPFLEPLLQKQIPKEGMQLKIKLGEDIPYSTDFKLYITTKLPNPHYLPDICIKVTIINFTVTPTGLEDQLLVKVVQYERPELETERGNLIINISTYQKELKDIENKILKMVSEASDDILNDDELINKLKESKEKSLQINTKMAEAQETSKKINRARDSYRPVAIRGSVLYFVIADLGLIEHMYQYSLDFYIQLFNLRLEKSTKSEKLEERMEILIKDLTWSFYSNICRGLFEKDKLLYSFLNATAIMRRAEGKGKVTPDEWNFFLRGSNTDYSSEKFDGDWLDTPTWQKVLGLEECSYGFRDLRKSFKDPEDVRLWKELMKSENPVAAKLPKEYEENLSAFQRVMLIKVLREEKLMSAVTKYVGETLAAKFTASPPYNLADCFADSTNLTPLIFVLSPGADPMIYLQGLARDKDMDTRLKTLSLGQGQGKEAARLIEDGRRSGEWVCLQNCHLAASWMPELEKIQEQSQAIGGEIHPDYRLWLTSNPTKAFPVPVLQSGIKITNEPPKGLKNNLARTFHEVKEEFYESCQKPEIFKKMLFALAFFHAVILERRKFGSIGWNIPYEWMDSDFEISKKQLLIYLNEQPDIPYSALNYLVADINYGGRVTDDKDSRLIKALITQYFNPAIDKPGFKLSPLDTYYIPAVGKLDEVFKYIENELPAEDSPEVFGLHANANITMQQKIVREFFDTLLNIQPRISGGRKGQTSEEIVIEIARKFQYSIRSSVKYLDKRKVPDFLANSLLVFLGQEVDRFNTLYGVIVKSLEDLQRAIKGEVVMSMDLEEMFKSFMVKKVPKNWEKYSYLSLKPLGSWVNDFIQRMEFMNRWLCDGPQKSYWLSAFFFPQGFMTAAKQMYARKTSTEIDTLIFKATFYNFTKDNVQVVPENGVNIHGLFLEGGALDNEQMLVESLPKQLFAEVPVLWYCFVLIINYKQVGAKANDAHFWREGVHVPIVQDEQQSW
eukprot:TRINITY_DN188_c0_g2_i1.p1 TRINITY_DN188_c0_g2~~TRINITY_DN188_c0_g2_i1.p1  ORF type:complete len:4549 (-),score=684.34 TRINITY_DN188_c0_g2_i1:241-13887(-)